MYRGVLTMIFIIASSMRTVLVRDHVSATPSTPGTDGVLFDLSVHNQRYSRTLYKLPPLDPVESMLSNVMTVAFTSHRNNLYSVSYRSSGPYDHPHDTSRT